MIVGLGNPGKQYEGTRHNVGWMVVDALASSHGIVSGQNRGVELKEDKKFSAQIGKGKVDGNAVILVKPTTYMNLSGKAVRDVADYYKIPASDVWVVTDDFNLPVGWIRVRQEGSAGGHNGLQSVLEVLGTQEVPRIRLGIGSMTAQGEEPAEQRMPEAEIFVLQKFTKREEPVIKQATDQAVHMILDGIGRQRLDSRTISTL